MKILLVYEQSQEFEVCHLQRGISNPLTRAAQSDDGCERSYVLDSSIVDK
jgi:hypothetical protein